MGAADFDGADLAVGVGVIPAGPQTPAVIILVVDDSDDDELVSVIAAADTVPAEDLGGGWASRLSDGAVRFKLERLSGGFERRWRLPGLAEDIVEASAERHYVAVLPNEIAGDLSNFTDVSRLGGGLIVHAFGTPALSIAWGSSGGAGTVEGS